MTKEHDGPDPIDLQVGARIRTRRRALGMSQEKLAEALGLTFQQVQKYERGANRVSMSKFVRICEALEVKPSAFLDGLADFQDNVVAGEQEGRQWLLGSEANDLARAMPKLPTAIRRGIITMANLAVSAIEDLDKPEGGHVEAGEVYSLAHRPG